MLTPKNIKPIDNAKTNSWIFQVHFIHFPYDTLHIESPISSTGLVGRNTSEKPSAMQYIKISKFVDIPITEHIGISIGKTKNILAEAEPMNTCKIKINK